MAYLCYLCPLCFVIMKYFLPVNVTLKLIFEKMQPIPIIVLHIETAFGFGFVLFFFFNYQTYYLGFASFD